MSLTASLSGFMIKREFNRAFDEVNSYLEEENYKKLSETREEASTFVSRYNNTFETLEKLIDEPYQASFALTLARRPLSSWRELGYCKAFSSLDYEDFEKF